MKSLIAFSYVYRGLRLLNTPGIRLYVVIPLLLNFTVFAVLIWAGMSYFGDFMNWLLPDESGGWLFLYWFLFLLFFFTAWLIVFYTFSIMANFIAAPFNSLLAEAVEYHLTGEKPPGNLLTAIKELFPSLKAELNKLFYLIAWSIPLFILSFIPGINLLAPFLWMLFSAWMMGLQYIDYPAGNHSIFFKQQRKMLASQRVRTMSFGGGVMLASMIPVFNFIVMPAAVVGATILWVETLSDSANE